MRANVVIGLVALTGLVGAALPAAAQEVSAEVRTWAGESWRLTQPSLELFYTIMPKSGEGAASPGGWPTPSPGPAPAQLSGSIEALSTLFDGDSEPKQGHRQRERVTVFRKGIEIQVSLATVRSLRFFRQPVEKSPLPPYVAATHFRHSATVVLVDGSSVEGDYVNLGTTVLRGMTPEGRVDIPWREIENVRFERTMVPKATQAKKGSPATVGGEVSLADVFFDFDMAVLRDDAKAALDRNIEWLRANPDVKLVVEGHADERGTKQYNLGLGGRRANAVRDYLAAAGVDGSRVSTISYGKERPFAAGHDESAWKVNRRAHFKTRSGAEAGPLPGAVLWVVRPERKER